MATSSNIYRCGFCNAHNHSLLYPTTDIFGNHWELHNCHECEAIFLAPFPTPEQFEQAYGEDYYGEGEEKFEGFFERLLDRFRMGRAKRFARFLKGSGRVLDIGCGNGTFLQYVKQQGD